MQSVLRNNLQKLNKQKEYLYRYNVKEHIKYVPILSTNGHFYQSTVNKVIKQSPCLLSFCTKLVCHVILFVSRYTL